MKTYNLMQQRWLPLRRKGKLDIEYVAPWEIVAGDPTFVDIVTPWPGMAGALLELLVGLCQTCLPPANRKQHLARLEQPPRPEELRQAFARLAPYCNLFGNGPRFMQDLELPPAKPKDRAPISSLLLDEPGDKTLTDATDFFVKRGRTTSMCPACAAMALYTLQTFAPSGGKGHRTSLRGGGPMGCIVNGHTLWQTVWSNVLPLTWRDVTAATDEDLASGAVLPWMAPTRTSENGETFSRSEGHFLHHFFGMPRRIRLHEERQQRPLPCSVCGQESDIMVAEYTTYHSGFNYDASWRHPLTPYRSQGQDKPTLSIKGKNVHAGYVDYPGLIYGQEKKGEKGVIPADCVQAWRSMRRGDRESPLRVYGYEMDNMTALMWGEGQLPLLHVEEELLEEYRELLEMLVLAADSVRGNLQNAVKEALFGEGSSVKADQTRLASLAAEFWLMTEADFFDTCREAIADPSLEGTDGLRLDWSRQLIQAADHLFEREALSGRFDDRTMKKRYKAFQQMQRFYHSKLKKVLQLPKKENKERAA